MRAEYMRECVLEEREWCCISAHNGFWGEDVKVRMKGWKFLIFVGKVEFEFEGTVEEWEKIEEKVKVSI